MAAKDLKPPGVCAECGRTMVAHHSWTTGNRRGAQTYWHDSTSGKCRACSQREERRRLKIEGLPRRDRQPGRARSGRSREEIDAERELMLDEYELIRDGCSDIAEAATRMGISYYKLDKALYRARQADDPRGRPPRAQLERAIDRGAPYGRRHPHGRAA